MWKYIVFVDSNLRIDRSPNLSSRYGWCRWGNRKHRDKADEDGNRDVLFSNRTSESFLRAVRLGGGGGGVNGMCRAVPCRNAYREGGGA